MIDLHDKYFPEKSFTKRYHTRKPWLTTCLREAIEKKNKLYYKSIKIKCMRTKKEYVLYRNQLRKLMRVTEKKYHADRIMENKHNSRKFWSIIKNIINRKKKSKFQEKFKLNDGSYTADMKIICESFNDFFINVGLSLSKKIPNQNCSLDQFIKMKAVYSVYLEPVTESEIRELVTSLKSAAPGYDNLRSSILKLSLPFICTPLTYISNLSLQEGVFPDELKIANVIPLFKSDDPELFNNYRPVSVLCSLSKVFERIMYNRLRNFLDEYKILFSYQFGFRKSHSTYMALMTLMDNLINFLDKGEYVIGIFLDFSKAFDTVDHGILLQKLSCYGVRGDALSWFQSYLNNMYHFVTYNGVSSDKKEVKCGVPQGSILGPLLFLIYINDLSDVCKCSLPILFADDTNLFHHGSDLSVIENAFNKELADISKWLKVNKLSLNVKKTHYMIFSRKKSNYQLDLRIDNQKIDETPTTKFLGVYIDNKLNWKTQISYVGGEIARGIGVLVKARKYFDNECMLKLYKAFIYPYLMYCNHVWGNTYKTNLLKLQILQNKAVRIVTGSSCRCNTDNIYRYNGIMNLDCINTYLTGRFMYKIYLKEVPDIFDDLFMYNYHIHDYYTRVSSHLHVPLASTNLSKTGIRYQGVIVWNKILTADINPDCSELSFKVMLKKCINQRLLQI